MVIMWGRDIFSFLGEVDAICITTNGYVNKRGKCVMGKGNAGEAAKRWKELPWILGEKIKKNGNVVNVLMQVNGTWIIAFPTKPDVVKRPSVERLMPHLRARYANKLWVPGFAVYSDINLIERSAKQVKELADRMGFQKIVLPLPGCGCGGLEPLQVLPILEKILDDRFIVCIKTN